MALLLFVRVLLQDAFSVVDRVASWARFFGAVILAAGHTMLLQYPQYFGNEYMLPSLIISWTLVLPELWAYGTRNGYAKMEDTFLKPYVAKWKRKYVAGVSYLEVSPGQPSQPSVNVVLLPGFAHGKGFLMPIAQKLAEEVNARVFALDPPGSGMSYPEFTTFRTVAQCESWMSSRLERWRKAAGLYSVIVIGHSMGGYFASIWALKHPSVVKQVILISPAGVPEEPVFTGALGIYALIFKLIGWVNLTPQTVLRLFGPFAEWMCYKQYVYRRYEKRGLDISDKWKLQEYAKYLAHYNAQPRSYENALHTVLGPGLSSRAPLYSRLLGGTVKCVDFIYGEWDWMCPDVGVALSMSLNQTSKVISNLRMIEEARHQIPIENPEKLSHAVCELIKLRRTKAAFDERTNEL